MTKQNFTALADAIRTRNHDNRVALGKYARPVFSRDALEILADFCQSQNPVFNRERWLGYIAGTNGSNGGKR